MFSTTATVPIVPKASFASGWFRLKVIVSFPSKGSSTAPFTSVDQATCSKKPETGEGSILVTPSTVAKVAFPTLTVPT